MFDTGVILVVSLAILAFLYFRPQLKLDIEAIIAIITVLGGFTIMWFKPDLKSEAQAAILVVLTFYFGSSPGSRRKDDTLSQIIQGGSYVPNQPSPAVVPAAVPEPAPASVRIESEPVNLGAAASPAKPIPAIPGIPVG